MSDKYYKELYHLLLVKLDKHGDCEDDFDSILIDFDDIEGTLEDTKEAIVGFYNHNIKERSDEVL